MRLVSPLLRYRDEALPSEAGPLPTMVSDDAPNPPGRSSFSETENERNDNLPSSDRPRINDLAPPAKNVDPEVAESVSGRSYQPHSALQATALSALGPPSHVGMNMRMTARI